MLPLRINMAPLQNVPVLRNIILDAGVVSKRTEWYDGDGPLPAEAIERMKTELDSATGTSTAPCTGRRR